MNVKADRASATRESILVTAERLFAEHGVHAVSNRHISETAGQGNNAAVNYHFGTKVDLVRAIARKHFGRIERLREELLETIGGDGELRDWVACLVRPSTSYLHELGSPTWFARFSAQVMTDPALRAILAEESLSSPVLARTVEGLNRCLDGLPPDVRAERGDMARQLMIHMTAERERALAEGTPTPRASWNDAGTGLIDAITGLLLAPVTPAP
ncbi:TetR/AcrR family transcriptional regulator [Amycolatopsis vancoresmycina]|uniref:TetR family transcriptional regulator n=1 Tax=Amycolatopsis vancoresmycina DSM 44592 TaxID=1292037 RepID=R1IDL2_9PSEU|nr:TetR/AcrR family transcriptional regulator [Amycolatopsis vancoresmycina]EOD70596.1 TetR family transcriptional regulator [Amycolatopsis vancoresmycina DSM 44592]